MECNYIADLMLREAEYKFEIFTTTYSSPDASTSPMTDIDIASARSIHEHNPVCLTNPSSGTAPVHIPTANVKVHVLSSTTAIVSCFGVGGFTTWYDSYGHAGTCGEGAVEGCLWRWVIC